MFNTLKSEQGNKYKLFVCILNHAREFYHQKHDNIPENPWLKLSNNFTVMQCKEIRIIFISEKE